jgi:lysophospholipase L1-like esterase
LSADPARKSQGNSKGRAAGYDCLPEEESVIAWPFSVALWLSTFPGQYARPADSRFPAWPSGCSSFEGKDRLSCLEYVAFDFGDLKRYAAANAALGRPQPGKPRVVFFGDSITDAWSSPAAGGFFPGKPYVNRGIGGQTTAQMLLRFRADVIANRPAVLVLLAGTNDVAGNAGPVTEVQIEDNLATMSELAKLHGIRVVLSSLLPVCDVKKDEAGQPRVQTPSRPPGTLKALNERLAAYAARHGHVFLDYHTALADRGGMLKPELTDDGLHPNRAGYAVMAPLAENAIAQALAK